MKKRVFIILSIALALLVALGVVLFLCTRDTTGRTDDGIKWKFQEKTGELTITGKGEMTNYTLENLPPWYAYRASVLSVTVSDGITSLGDYAFYRFEEAKTITLPHSIKTIGDYALAGCTKITSIVLPENVTSLGDYALYNCRALTKVILPEAVLSLGAGAFSSCGALAKVYVPAKLETIGKNAFINCAPITFYCRQKEAPKGWDATWLSNGGGREHTVEWKYQRPFV